MKLYPLLFFLLPLMILAGTACQNLPQGEVEALSPSTRTKKIDRIYYESPDLAPPTSSY